MLQVILALVINLVDIHIVVVRADSEHTFVW
jgi:hypothetical protein